MAAKQAASLCVNWRTGDSYVVEEATNTWMKNNTASDMFLAEGISCFVLADSIAENLGVLAHTSVVDEQNAGIVLCGNE